MFKIIDRVGCALIGIIAVSSFEQLVHHRYSSIYDHIQIICSLILSTSYIVIYILKIRKIKALKSLTNPSILLSVIGAGVSVSLFIIGLLGKTTIWNAFLILFASFNNLSVTREAKRELENNFEEKVDD